MLEEFGETMDGATALQMLQEVEAQGGIRIAKVLRLRWSDENNQDFLWSVNDCLVCNTEQQIGDVGFIWGKPLTNDPDCPTLSMVVLCSEECVERAMEAWAADLKMDVMTGYFTEDI